MLSRLSVFGLLLLTPACNAGRTNTSEPGSQPAETRVEANKKVSAFGEKLKGVPAASLTELMKAPDSYAGQTVEVQAQVRRACSAKGCWMELAQSDTPDAPACRVTFKDYGFFVPTDSAGAAARVQGEVVVRTVPASHVTHLEGEGATFQHKNADGTATEVQLVATGVELTRL